MATYRAPSPKTLARIALGKRRIINILRRHTVANMRTIEQKIADAGPTPQRVEPIHLTTALKELIDTGQVKSTLAGGSQTTRWYYLTAASQQDVDSRLHRLLGVWRDFNKRDNALRRGQTLEIAIYRALCAQDHFDFQGEFTDLNDHDDTMLYTKTEPPSHLSGRRAPGHLDFLLCAPDRTWLGVEAKNIREWLYPDRNEIRHFLAKCCALRVVPVLIARRIPYVAFSEVFKPCGIIVHQTYNQLLPGSDQDLATRAGHKDLLGYHDIRTGNAPDSRLNRFLHENLPQLVQGARDRFFEHIDILEEFAHDLQYSEFIAKLKGAWNDPDTLTDEDWRAIWEDLGY